MDGLLTDVRKKWKGLLSDAENLSIGMGHGISNQMEGMYQMASHPVQAVKALYGAGKAIYDNPSVVGGLLSDAYNQATSGPLGFGQFVGENMSLRPRAPRSLLELTTYHGSPHRINNVTPDAPYGKFDLSKVGTGEGAQAYGHGIYLAETPSVARTYMSGNPQFVANHGVQNVLLDGQLIDYPTSTPQGVAIQAFKGGLFGDTLPEQLGTLRKHGFTEAADWLEQNASRMEISKGHFYTVDLPDEHIAKMLDWDAPLSEQPEAVRKALEQHGFDVSGVDYGDTTLYDKFGVWEPKSLTGGLAYQQLSSKVGKAKASELLKAAGIPGIKYFDGGSRAAGEGTRNFVIFDPDIAKILKRE